MGKILQAGDVIHDGMEVLGELPSGNLSEMYVVKRARVNLVNLLKVNLPHDLLGPDVPLSGYEHSKLDPVERTKNEAKILAWLDDHDNIAKIEDVVPIKGDYTGILFTRLPKWSYLLPRSHHFGVPSLRTVIDGKLGLSHQIKDFPAIAKGLFDALVILQMKWAYSGITIPNPIFHRDIRPENIVLSENSKPYLVDFGLATQEFDGMWGSLTYGPPEIYLGAKEWADDYDAWSVGLVLYEQLTGQHLIDNSPDKAVRREKIGERVKSLNEKKPAIEYQEELLEKFSELEKACMQVEKEEYVSEKGKLRYYLRSQPESAREFQALLAAAAYLCQPTGLLDHESRRINYITSLRTFLKNGHTLRDEYPCQISAKKVLQETLKKLKQL